MRKERSIQRLEGTFSNYQRKKHEPANCFWLWHFCCCGVGNRTQGFRNVQQTLSHRATSRLYKAGDLFQMERGNNMGSRVPPGIEVVTRFIEGSFVPSASPRSDPFSIAPPSPSSQRQIWSTDEYTEPTQSTGTRASVHARHRAIFRREPTDTFPLPCAQQP